MFKLIYRKFVKWQECQRLSKEIILCEMRAKQLENPIEILEKHIKDVRDHLEIEAKELEGLLAKTDDTTRQTRERIQLLQKAKKDSTGAISDWQKSIEMAKAKIKRELDSADGMRKQIEVIKQHF